MSDSITIPIQSGHYIQLAPIDPKNVVGEEQATFFSDCTILDVLLARKTSDTEVNIQAVLEVAKCLSDFMYANPNTILYFFCDVHDNNIIIRERSQKITPQKFRSELFSRLFERMIKRDGNPCGFINSRYIVNIGDGNGDAYLHLIYPNQLSTQAELIKTECFKMLAK